MKIGDGSTGTGAGAAAGRDLTSTGGATGMREAEGDDASSLCTSVMGADAATGDDASERAPPVEPAAARRFTTVGRMRSSTVLGDLALSRWRFTRSTISGPIALMWLRTSGAPTDWSNATRLLGSMPKSRATSYTRSFVVIQPPSLALFRAL
jgi:hypothetical protein